MPPETCVLGIGSPHGDDQAGWRLIERLRRLPHLTATCSVAADPLQLIHWDHDFQRLILIDACKTGQAAGTISRLLWPDPRIAAVHGHSSHNLSVAEALELARQLQRLPDCVVLFGIEVGDCSPGAKVSTAVSDALPTLEQRVLQELEPSRIPETETVTMEQAER